MAIGHVERFPDDHNAVLGMIRRHPVDTDAIWSFEIFFEAAWTYDILPELPHEPGDGMCQRSESLYHRELIPAHSLLGEQGRIEMPQVPRYLRRCTFCATNAIGDERHCVFDCPHFQGLRQQHAQVFQNSHDAVRFLMWHSDQKSVCALVLAIVNEAQTA